MPRRRCTTSAEAAVATPHAFRDRQDRRRRVIVPTALAAA